MDEKRKLEIREKRHYRLNYFYSRNRLCISSHDSGGLMNQDLKDIPESAVIAEVKEIIKITGIKLQRINTGCFAIGTGRNRRYIRTADAGTCDFEGYDNHGRFVAIECKRPVGGKISPAQKWRIDDINAKGGVAFIAHSGQEALEQLKSKGCL